MKQIAWLPDNIVWNGYLNKFRRVGIDVDRFGSIHQGLEELKTRDYPLIIIAETTILDEEDYEAVGHMENPTVEEILERTIEAVRRLPGYQETPIIVPYMTSKSSGRFLEAGATRECDVFNQPRPLDKLVEIVREFLFYQNTPQLAVGMKA